VFRKDNFYLSTLITKESRARLSFLNLHLIADVNVIKIAGATKKLPYLRTLLIKECIKVEPCEFIWMVVVLAQLSIGV
jgi:hypothetical protein